MATTKIEYFNGSTKIGERTSIPFDEFTWVGAPLGTHTLTAKLYDEVGLVNTSSIKNITVNALSSSYEAETITFMNSISIADDTLPTIYDNVNGTQLWSIIDTYIKELKAANLFIPIVADYALIGGTTATHSKNLKDPSTFPITWFNGWVHNKLGALGNGTNTYGNTGVVPSTSLNALHSITAAIGTNNIPLNTIAVEATASSVSTANIMLRVKNGGLTNIRGNLNDTANAIIVKQPTAMGVSTVSKQASDVHKIFRNGILQGTGIGGGTLPTNPILFGCFSNNSPSPFAGSYSNQRQQGLVISSALSDAEALTLNNIISKRELALGRKTW